MTVAVFPGAVRGGNSDATFTLHLACYRRSLAVGDFTLIQNTPLTKQPKQ